MVLTFDRSVAVVLSKQRFQVPVTDIDINLDTLLIMHNSLKLRENDASLRRLLIRI